MPEPTTPLTCIDCGAKITPRSRNGRCRPCGARHAARIRRPGSFGFRTPEAARAARQGQVAQQAEDRELAAWARAHGAPRSPVEE